MRFLKKFISNGIILTSTSLFLRWINVLFNTYISNKLGSEGMGVYSLVQTVFGFAITFACSGINLATIRLVSEAIANQRVVEVKKAMKSCAVYSLLFSVTALFAVFFGAEFIGRVMFSDLRTVKSIKILALTLPFISMSSVFSGYFSAIRRVYKNAFIMILEQLIQITVTVKVLGVFSVKGVEYACISVAVGTLVSEVLSLSANLIMWLFDVKKLKYTSNYVNPNLLKKLLSVSIPLALSTYIRSALVTLEHLLIPFGLRKNGASYSASMSSYGLVHGMVFPLIMFPSCIIYSFAGLLVPELARYNEKKEYKKINNAVSKVIKYALCFSIGVSGIITCFAYELSVVFYKTSESYVYIRLFAPLVTVMYLDGAVDGLLKGLNQQLHSMKINIADAVLSVLMVYFLVPHFGVKGYVVAIFVCEIFNCGMSLMRLVKISEPNLSVVNCLVKPIVCIVFATSTVVYLFNVFNLTKLTVGVNLFLRISLVITIYLIMVLGDEIFKIKIKKKQYT